MNGAILWQAQVGHLRWFARDDESGNVSVVLEHHRDKFGRECRCSLSQQINHRDGCQDAPVKGEQHHNKDTSKVGLGQRVTHKT